MWEQQQMKEVDELSRKGRSKIGAEMKEEERSLYRRVEEGR